MHGYASGAKRQKGPWTSANTRWELKGMTYFFKQKLFVYLFIFGCVGSSLLSLVAVSGGYSLLQFAGLLWWLLLLQSTGSRCVGSVVVARRLSSCGSWA